MKEDMESQYHDGIIHRLDSLAGAILKESRRQVVAMIIAIIKILKSEILSESDYQSNVLVLSESEILYILLSR
ncbi:MAG: hypothetical protein ACMUIU_14640 [bacterium]